MNSYKDIKKVLYKAQTPNDFCDLEEYILFTSEDGFNKTAVFKFKNKLDQIMHALDVYIYQYDKDNNLIEKSLIKFKTLNVLENQSFVPDRKFICNPMVDSIQIEVKYCLFERIAFEEGKVKELVHNFDEYVEEYRMGKTTEEVNETEVELSKKEKKAKEKSEKNQNSQIKKVKKKKVIIKDITKEGTASKTKSYTRIMSVILLVFVLIFARYTYKNSNTLVDGNFEYSINNDRKTVTISKYRGTDTNVTIVSSITVKDKTYSVIGVESRAFYKNEYVTNLVIESTQLNISQNAFKDCKKLQSVKASTSACTVNTGAFIGCDKLSSVDMPNSKLLTKCFDSDCEMLVLKAKSTSAIYLYSLFDGKKSNAGFSENMVVNFTDSVSVNFYNNFLGSHN